MKRFNRQFILFFLCLGIVLPNTAIAQSEIQNFVIAADQTNDIDGFNGTLATGMACQNTESTPTTAKLTFYNSDGSTKTTVANDHFLGNWQVFNPNQQGASYLGAAIFRSGLQAICTLNLQTTSGSLSARVGTATGLGNRDVGTKLYATQIVNNLGGFNSFVMIQNTDNLTTSVTAKYFDIQGKQVYTESRDLNGYGSTIWSQSSAGLADGFIGSAIFESSDEAKLAGAIALFNSGSNSTNAQLLFYDAVNGGSNKVFLPRMVKNLSGVGYTSGWACQNLGPGSADLTMQLKILNQSTNVVEDISLTHSALGEGQSWNGYLASNTGTALDAISMGYGSAVVTSTGGLIACTVNEDNRSTFAGRGSTYNGIPDGKQSTTIFFPQIVALGSHSFRGGFQISNTSPDESTCIYTFTSTNGEVEVFTDQKIPGEGSKSIFAESILVNHKTTFNGSVLVECNQPIVGIYNLAAAVPGDTFATGSGVNK